MLYSESASPTLINELVPPIEHPWIRNIVLALAGSMILTISSKLQIPMYPVPITMQPFVVLILGMALGSRLAAATVALYLLEGAMGLAVFANTPEKGLGIGYMLGTTGGYLIGFLFAAFLCGKLAEQGWDRSYKKTFLIMTLGLVVIYFFGVSWLSLQPFPGESVTFGWDRAVKLGLIPFLIGDLIKILSGVLVMPLIWNYLEKENKNNFE